jgi:uncharacterized protein with HEPN domain
MSPQDEIRLKHMVGAGTSALKFIEGRSRADLDSDQLLVFGLVRAVEIVGEAASKVSPEGRAELPELPWNNIIGMRNRLIHAYFDVDADILWNTVTEALPGLLSQVQAALGKVKA